MVNLSKCCHLLCPSLIFSSCHLQCLADLFWHLLSPPSSSSHLLLHFALSKASCMSQFPPLSCPVPSSALSHTQYTSNPRLSSVLFSPGTLPLLTPALWTPALSPTPHLLPMDCDLWNSRFFSSWCVWWLPGFACCLLVTAQGRSMCACPTVMLQLLDTCWPQHDVLSQQQCSWDIYSFKWMVWCLAQRGLWCFLFGLSIQL